jgi:hypothetical protein
MLTDIQFKIKIIKSPKFKIQNLIRSPPNLSLKYIRKKIWRTESHSYLMNISVFIWPQLLYLLKLSEETQAIRCGNRKLYWIWSLKFETSEYSSDSTRFKDPISEFNLLIVEFPFYRLHIQRIQMPTL